MRNVSNRVLQRKLSKPILNLPTSPIHLPASSIEISPSAHHNIAANLFYYCSYSSYSSSKLVVVVTVIKRKHHGAVASVFDWNELKEMHHCEILEMNTDRPQQGDRQAKIFFESTMLQLVRAYGIRNRQYGLITVALDGKI